MYDYTGHLGRIGGGWAGQAGVYISDLYEKHADGSVRKYYYAGGQRIAMRDTNVDSSTSFRYFAQDHLGSTVLEFDGRGVATSRVFYSAYGDIIATEGLPRTSRLFTGYLRLGVKSGFYYAGARFYSARLGQFLSPDPVMSVVGDSRTINSYAYAANNPMTFTDEYGLCFGEALVPCPSRFDDFLTSFVGNMLCCSAPTSASSSLELTDFDRLPEDAQNSEVCRLKASVCLDILGIEDSSNHASSIGVQGDVTVLNASGCAGVGLITDSSGTYGYGDLCSAAAYTSLGAAASVNLTIAQVYGANAKDTEGGGWYGNACLHVIIGGCAGVSVGPNFSYFGWSIGAGLGGGAKASFSPIGGSVRDVFELKKPW